MKERGWSIAVCLLFGLAVVAGPLGPTARAEESLGAKIKQLLDPTPPPKKRKSTGTRKTRVSKPSPSPTPKQQASPSSSASPSPTASPRRSPSPSATPAVSATPKRKGSPSPSPKSGKKKSSPSPSPSASPSPEESPSPSPTASPSATPEEEESPSPTPEVKTGRSTGVTLAPDEIAGFEQYPAAVKKLLEASLALAGRDLMYKYGSADPSNGGLDCSGFIYHVLRENGFKDVPRDSSQQYVWVRKTGTFNAVVSKNDESFELEELKPGDLLFWTGTYDIKRDPPITHVMIYAGREKSTGRRVMVGASDGRTYHDKSRYGVSVFDFKVARTGRALTSGRVPDFVGYGRIPGLSE